MEPIQLQPTVAQAALMRQIGLSFSCAFDEDNKRYIVELRGPDEVLLCVGSSPSKRFVLDVVLDGYVAVYGEKLPAEPPAPPVTSIELAAAEEAALAAESEALAAAEATSEMGDAAPVVFPPEDTIELISADGDPASDEI